MPRRRSVLRLVGATAAGGVGTALAGCTARSSDGDATERLGAWAYDPTEYGDGWQQYSFEYQDPAALSRNRMYLSGAQRQRLFLSVPWADFGDLDAILDIGAAGEGGPYPRVTVVEGSYGIGDVRGPISDGSSRVSTVAGRELYADERGTFVAIDHGEVVLVRGLDQRGTEAYLGQSDRSFVPNTPEFGQFVDRVGFGAYTNVTLAPGEGGIGGVTYDVDGPTTTVRLLRPQSLTTTERERFQRRVSAVGARLGYPDAATFEYENGRFFLSLRMETHEAPIGGDPLAVLEM
jgi:hypothetical protein